MIEDPEFIWAQMDLPHEFGGQMVILEWGSPDHVQLAIRNKFIADIPKLVRMIIKTPLVVGLNQIFVSCLQEIFQQPDKFTLLKKLLWQELAFKKPLSSVNCLNLVLLERVCKTRNTQVSPIEAFEKLFEIQTYSVEYRKLCLVIFHNWLPNSDFNRVFAEMLLTRI